MNNIIVELELKFYGDMRRSYNLYKAMREWLIGRDITHSFKWKDTRYYLPGTIVLDAESAVMFTLTFLVDQ